MGEVFLKVLNMSIAASWLILAVAALRLLLRRTPKWLMVLLWGVAALRLTLPLSLESAWSLVPSAETFSAQNIQYETPVITSGIPAVNHAVNPVLGETFPPNPGGSVNPLYVWTFIVSVIWVVGMAVMLFYAVISYVRVRRSVAESVPYEGDLFLCDHVRSPFILGLVRPKIYLPSGLDASALAPVIAHERAHLARRDHWWKPLGYLILTAHWFNPLCWLAYVLLCRDIELACDEKVIRQMDLEGKKQYSTALLSCSAGGRLVSVCPLAFGEVGVKERVKNVLKYKRPAFWVILAALAACAVVTVCFATNPKQDRFRLEIVIPAGSQAPVVYADEEISPLRSRIVVTSAAGLGDTEVSLKPVEVRTETAYDEPAYLTPGMPVEMEAEKGGWFKIGVNVQNDTDKDIRVYLEVRNVHVRIASSGVQDGLDDLRAKYPDYFDLGTFKGLEVYVWQMAENHYRFGLLPGTNREKTLEELMDLEGTTAEEMARILSSYDIPDKDIFVIPWQNPLSSYLVPEDERQAPERINNIRAMLGLDGIAANPAAQPGTPSDETDAPATTLSAEQTALQKAILGHHRSPETPVDILSCCSFVTLDQISEPPAEPDGPWKTTYYGWALYEEYQVTEAGLKTVRGSHIPAALTFEHDDYGYSLLEYWEPRDGSYFAQDIQAKFPASAAKDGMDSQKYILPQTQACYAQAAAASGLDTAKVIGAHLETICASPALSSNPRDYIEAHPIEYRELTYYGRYTLRYCFAEFLKGGQTDLRGHIMRALLDDLAPEAQLKLLAETGQEYFDAWKAAAESLREQHDLDWLAKNQPAAYQLLEMMQG